MRFMRSLEAFVPARKRRSFLKLTLAACLCPIRRTFLYNMSKKHDQYGDVR